MTDVKKLATAKLEFLVAVALDAELPKLAVRTAAILAGRYMHSQNDGVAWPRIARLCDDLQIRSESKVRDALYALVDGGYLDADRNRGETTRYSIAPRFFETGTQPQDGAGSVDTPPRSGAEGAPRSRATPQPQDGAGSPPHRGATNTVKGNPLIEDRKTDGHRSDEYLSDNQSKNQRDVVGGDWSSQESFPQYRRKVDLDDDLPF
jgi:hypothetical protein